MSENAEQPRAVAPVGEKRWVDTIATISSALIAVGTLLNWFFGKQTSFPHWFFFVLTFFIVIILYKYFEDSIRRMIQALAVRSYLRQAHFQLVDSLQRFNQLVTQRSDDSIVRVLQTISSRTGKEMVDRDLYDFADQLVGNVFLKLSETGKVLSVTEFKGVINELAMLVRFSTHFYFKKPFQGYDLGRLAPDEVKNLELARENYADFVRRFQIFYDEVHTRLGSTSRSRLEIPKPWAMGVSSQVGS